MSTAFKSRTGTSRTALTTTAMNSLGSGTYVNCGTLTFESSSLRPLGCKIEVTATPGTVSGNKQLVVFCQQSLDGTNFETGPTLGSTTTDEPNLTQIGTLPLNTNSTAQTRVIDLAAALGGQLPYAAKIIVKNDSGAALAASGHSVYYETSYGDGT